VSLNLQILVWRKIFDVDERAAHIEAISINRGMLSHGMGAWNLQQGQGCLLVYSISSRRSFYEVKTLREKMLEIDGDRPIVLVGNRQSCDEDREISFEGTM
jgi:hypothetical protein